MGSIRDRVKGVLDRGGDLAPLAARVRDRHKAGQRLMAVNGVDQFGRPVAPLAPSTLARRRGTGPPRAPDREASRVVRECVVSVSTAGNTLSTTKSWPGFEAAHYLDQGTSRMPGRGMGLRREDLDRDREDLRRWVLDGEL